MKNKNFRMRYALLGLVLELGEEALPFKVVFAAFDGTYNEDLAGQLKFILHSRIRPG